MVSDGVLTPLDNYAIIQYRKNLISLQALPEYYHLLKTVELFRRFLLFLCTFFCLTIYSSIVDMICIAIKISEME